eukprot:COSAG01_NODE_63010_length_281_cov_46.005495_2_plen_42_part_01
MGGGGGGGISLTHRCVLCYRPSACCDGSQATYGIVASNGTWT